MTENQPSLATTSPTEGVPKLPFIGHDYWVLRAENKEQRDELLWYAASKGVPCWELNEIALDTELDIAWCQDLMAYSSPCVEYLRKVSIPEFRLMCAAYLAQSASHA